MGLKSRFKQIRTAENLSLSGIAKKFSETKDKMYSIESGRQKIPGYILQRIVVDFNVDAHWLLTGEGQMYRSDESAVKEVPQIYRSQLIDNQDQAKITAFIEDWFDTSTADEKIWLNVQMQRCFPEFKSFIDNRKADSKSRKSRVECSRQ